MARKIRFGQTWWALAWRDALLNRADSDSRRLQRGKGYASKGAIASLSLTTDGATATVKGSQGQVYEQHIAFEPWSPPQQAQAQQLLKSNALWAAALGHQDLPRAFVKALSQAGLSLLPLEQEAVDLECTCPDGAAPCKHTAAVAYLLAQHLDRQPRLLLQWRGVDTTNLLIAPPLARPIGFWTTTSTAPAALPEGRTAPYPLPVTVPEAWLAVLPSSGLFYAEGDLKQRLAELYERLVAEVQQHPQQLLGERDESLHHYLQTAQKLPFVTPNAQHLRVDLRPSTTGERSTTPLGYIEDLVKLLKTTHLAELPKYPTSWQWLHGIYRWVQQLALQKALLPRLVSTTEGWVQQWIPYPLTTEIAENQQAWAAACPLEIQALGGDGRFWKPLEALRYWCHALASYWVGRATTYWLSHARKGDRLLWYAWVGKEPVAFEAPDSLTLPDYWHSWLAPLQLATLDHRLVLQIERAGSGYLFSIKIKIDQKPPSAWEDWLAEATQAERTATLATAYALSRYWEPLEQLLQEPSSGTVFCSAALYQGAQTQFLPLLQVLGVAVIEIEPSKNISA